MKKNSLPEDNIKKGTKGFYAALGISAVMIGSACFFAYDSGGKDPAKLSSPDTVVGKRADDVPKYNAYSYTFTTTSRTTLPTTTTVAITTTKPVITATVPAAEITIDEPEAEQADVKVEGFAEASGKLENPHPPLAEISNILSPFSAGELVKSETTGAWQTHNGTDIKAEVGAEVYAVSSGEIIKIDDDPLWGVTVLLDHHNGFTTKYCGLGTDLSVQEGDTISGGELIGVVGNTADIESSSEPHLHIEITHNGRYVDIMNYIK